MQPADRDRRRLLAVKLAHTAIWAVFAGAVVGIPVATFVGDIRLGLWLSVLVWVEVAIASFVVIRYGPKDMGLGPRPTWTDPKIPDWNPARKKEADGQLAIA